MYNFVYRLVTLIKGVKYVVLGLKSQANFNTIRQQVTFLELSLLWLTGNETDGGVVLDLWSSFIPKNSFSGFPKVD